MIRVDYDVAAVNILMEFLASEHDRVQLFFYLGIILFSFVE